jgi:hypothetical protein
MNACPFCGGDAEGDCCRMWASIVGVTCSHCKAKISVNPAWRWNGREWEHRCPGAHAQAGHFKQEKTDG